MGRWQACPQTGPPLYIQLATYEQGKLMLYMVLLKALYRTVWAALLFWQKLTKHLKGHGFQVNPYDACVMNSTVELCVDFTPGNWSYLSTGSRGYK